MRFEGALHVHDGSRPGDAVERAVAFSRQCGWGESLGIGSAALPAGRLTRLSTVRARYRKATASVPETVPVIYHQLAGLDLFATEDLGRHRIFWIQESFVRWPTVMGWAARYADAFVFESQATYDEMLAQVNWIPGKRRAVVTHLDREATSPSAEILGGFLGLPMKRNAPSPGGWLNLLGFYRRQISWIV